MIRALLDDQAGDFADDAYLLPFIQFVQQQMSTEVMQNPELGQLSGVVIIPDVPIFTTSLSRHFDVDGSLELLMDVTSIKERPSGGTREPQDFVWMDRTRDVPTYTPGSFNGSYAFTGADIALPGCDQTMDLRIFGKFAIRTLVDENSPLVPNTSAILVGRTAGMVAASRGNDRMADRYETIGLNAQSSFVCDAIMEMQNVRTRMRSFSGRGRY